MHAFLNENCILSKLLLLSGIDVKSLKSKVLSSLEMNENQGMSRSEMKSY